MSEKTIQLKDAFSHENAVIIMRLVDENIGLCLSLETNGDAEIFLAPAELRRLITALQEIEQAARP